MQSLVPATLFACQVVSPVPACGLAAGNPTINGFTSAQWASTGPDYYVTGAAVDAGTLAGRYKYASLKARVRAGVSPAVITSPVTLSDSPAGWTNAAGAYWAWVQGPVTVTGGTVANSKLILLVDGPVNITGNITVSNRTSGHVIIISGGNMTVGGTVANIDGIYMTDGIFDTGGSAATPLTVNGSVVAWTGLTLARSSSDNGSYHSRAGESLKVTVNDITLKFPAFALA
ncbi:hypothetical protein HYS82_00675, partial [Candidatus Amesbacteria bacterium]|nr:hypothetical protein [Candidatus Amesbacteria bacterium]